ncbi:MAG: tRNA lysidine(34) synthetase TilS [Sulfitobacter sp.]
MQLDHNKQPVDAADALLLAAVDAAFSHLPTGRIGIAVSGGGDSMALLHLSLRYAQATGCEIEAVTVDHGLRDESVEEAAAVATFCRAHDIPHHILTWTRPDGTGNLPALARDARYALMAEWAQEHGITSIALGHTADDGAENFLMRLGRAAGVDGLASMQSRFKREGILWMRPLWQCSREALRDYLKRHSVTWTEDPSNDDPRYLRSRTRIALMEVGIDAAAINHSAHALRQARDALAHYTCVEARRHVRQDAGDLLIPVNFDPAVPPDIERRLLVGALQWVASRAYAPRKISADYLAEMMSGQDSYTVAGCLILREGSQYRITREFNAVRDTITLTNARWDGRWRLVGPHAPDLMVRALGESLQEIPDWRDRGIPRASLMASPAVWRGETLIAAPLVGYNHGWSVQIVADYVSFLESH